MQDEANNEFVKSQLAGFQLFTSNIENTLSKFGNLIAPLYLVIFDAATTATTVETTIRELQGLVNQEPSESNSHLSVLPRKPNLNFTTRIGLYRACESICERLEALKKQASEVICQHNQKLEAACAGKSACSKTLIIYVRSSKT